MKGMMNPTSVEDVVELLIPELQKRGIYQTEYPVPGGTLRENMQVRPGQPLLAPDHPGAKVRWDAPKPVQEEVLPASGLATEAPAVPAAPSSALPVAVEAA